VVEQARTQVAVAVVAVCVAQSQQRAVVDHLNQRYRFIK
jgi:hypothetical protein